MIENNEQLKRVVFYYGKMLDFTNKPKAIDYRADGVLIWALSFLDMNIRSCYRLLDLSKQLKNTVEAVFLIGLSDEEIIKLTEKIRTKSSVPIILATRTRKEKTLLDFKQEAQKNNGRFLLLCYSRKNPLKPISIKQCLERFFNLK